MILSLTRKRKYSDKEYVRYIQLGERRITESFYNECRKYFMASYQAVFTKESIKDDVFQQSFVKLWTEIETRRIYLTETDGICRTDRYGRERALTCSLRTFLIDIAKNDYREWLRKDRLTLEDDFESFAHMMEVASAVSPDESDDNVQEQIVAACVMELPPRCKEILTMFYYQGLSLDEILVRRGEKNVSKDGLKTSKYKCMQSLKSKVRDAYANRNKY